MNTREVMKDLIKSLPPHFREQAETIFYDTNNDELWTEEYLNMIWVDYLISIRHYLTIDERKQCKYVGENKMNLLENDIQGYFADWNFKVINIDECIKYLHNHGYLKDFEDVVEENIEHYDIRCPEHFLDTQNIVECDDDYIEVGDGLWNIMYLNHYLLEDCDGFKELLENKIIKKGE